MTTNEKQIFTFNVDEMEIQQLRDTIKMLVRLMNHEHDRFTALQDRVLILEGEFNNKQIQKEAHSN
jgi:hypothetical protein